MTLVPTALEHRKGATIRAHAKADCDGPPCPLHHRTDHHMRSFPQVWRDDRGLMERICPHGIGHPDPDDRKASDPVEGMHGCDGCCTP